MVPQHNITTQICPVPAREGRYVDHHFENGASGLFGEEAPGEWMDESEAVSVYRSIFLRYRLFGDDGIVHRLVLPERILRHFDLRPTVGWYDTHATMR